MFKPWISFASQLALVVGLTGFVFYALPVQNFFLFAVLTALVTSGLIASASVHLERTYDWWIMTFVYAIVFGALWPGLPIIVAWGAVKHRAASNTPSTTVTPEDSAAPPSGYDAHRTSEEERKRT